jgi:hypothetical protein
MLWKMTKITDFFPKIDFMVKQWKAPSSVFSQSESTQPQQSTFIRMIAIDGLNNQESFNKKNIYESHLNCHDVQI